MGVLYYGAIQRYYPGTTHTTSNLLLGEGWQTVAIFEFQKDYDLSLALEKIEPLKGKDAAQGSDLLPWDEWPVNVKTYKSEDMPGPFKVYDGPPSFIYVAFLATLDSIKQCGELTRVVFWSDT